MPFSLERILHDHELAPLDRNEMWCFWWIGIVWGAPCDGGVSGTCVAELSEALARNASEGPPLLVSHRPSGGRILRVYDDNASRVANMRKSLKGSQEADLEAFYEHYKRNRTRYESVAREVDLPPELIAALHWRESTGDFGRYMHQGDFLGRPPIHHPTDIPLFYNWEASAIHAFGQKGGLQSDLRINRGTSDLAALATYAEYYNGLGYHYKGQPSPYAFSGTNQYSRGKYTSDGRYSRYARDRQLGVGVMIQTIWDEERGPIEV